MRGAAQRKKKRTWIPPDGRAALESATAQFRENTTVASLPGVLLPPLFYVDYQQRHHANVCQFFLKKDEARDFARERGNLPMWSIDKFSGVGDNAGAKYFVVASYDVFFQAYCDNKRPDYGGPNVARDDCWRRYDDSSLSSRDRQQCLQDGFKILPFAYEVQMEGVPLHLYLDIEGSRVTNPSVDFELLMRFALDEFVRFTCDCRLVPVELLQHPELVILDSSTTSKFSKHIVYKIPQCVFANNYVCGALMNAFQHHIDAKFGDPQSSQNPFYIRPFGAAKDQAQLVPFIDFAVYTKFRDFRLLGSCKRKGCNSPDTQLRWLWLEGKQHEMTKELWLECLCQNVNYADDATRYEIGYIYDKRQPDGVPRSSSLRTAAPVNGFGGSGSGVKRLSTLSSTRDAAFVRGLPSRVQKELVVIAKDIGRWLVNAPELSDYFPPGTSKQIKVEELRQYDGIWRMMIRCYTKYCRIKGRAMTNNPIAISHTSNPIYFCVGLNGFTGGGYAKLGMLTQKCFSQHGACQGGNSEWESLRDLLPSHFKERLARVIAPIFGDGGGEVQAQQQEECMFIDEED
jgi:hypothetical protein